MHCCRESRSNQERTIPPSSRRTLRHVGEDSLAARNAFLTFDPLELVLAGRRCHSGPLILGRRDWLPCFARYLGLRGQRSARSSACLLAAGIWKDWRWRYLKPLSSRGIKTISQAMQRKTHLGVSECCLVCVLPREKNLIRRIRHTNLRTLNRSYPADTCRDVPPVLASATSESLFTSLPFLSRPLKTTHIKLQSANDEKREKAYPAQPAIPSTSVWLFFCILPVPREITVPNMSPSSSSPNLRSPFEFSLSRSGVDSFSFPDRILLSRALALLLDLISFGASSARRKVVGFAVQSHFTLSGASLSFPLEIRTVRTKASKLEVSTS
jgi:hypothetical protein